MGKARRVHAVAMQCLRIGTQSTMLAGRCVMSRSVAPVMSVQSRSMAGHSKWKTIKHRKGAADAKRGKLFTKLGIKIASAARAGTDPETNAALAAVLQRCRAVSMPKDNIQRALTRSADKEYFEILYECTGPSGSALMIEALTDNKKRTAPEIRAILSKNEGQLAASGGAAWMFKKQGVHLVEEEAGEDLETVLEAAMEWDGVEDVEIDEITNEDDDTSSRELRIVCEVTAHGSTRNELAKCVDPARISGGIEYVPLSTIPVAEDSSFHTILAELEDNDDVQQVYHNVEC